MSACVALTLGKELTEWGPVNDQKNYAQSLFTERFWRFLLYDNLPSHVNFIFNDC